MREGERQVAPTLDGIRADHRARYEFAAARFAGKTIVDCGCGVGYGSAILAATGSPVFAFDLDPEAIAYAKAHYGVAGVDYTVCDAARYAIHGADGAVCFEVLEHVDDPLTVLKHLSEMTENLICSVPNERVYPWHEGIAYHRCHYTAEQFEALLNAAGWQVEEFHGQREATSPVEPNIQGRTLIAVCRRCDEPVGGKWRELPRLPMRVAILALGPSLTKYVELVKRFGGREKFFDEVWTINALGDVFACDRIFHMDDVRIQEIRAAAAPSSNIAEMLKWLKRHPGPVYTSRPHADYRGLVPFPLEAVINHLGFAYFNSTAAYAVAYAVHLGVGKLSLFGFDFTYPNAHDAEKGRACVEFWLGQAAARGIKIVMPQASSLMDACHSSAERLYGYDTVDVTLSPLDGNMKVSFTEKTVLPTADEIEARYDHSRHPSPLVED